MQNDCVIAYASWIHYESFMLTVRLAEVIGLEGMYVNVSFACAYICLCLDFIGESKFVERTDPQRSQITRRDARDPLQMGMKTQVWSIGEIKWSLQKSERWRGLMPFGRCAGTHGRCHAVRWASSHSDGISLGWVLFNGAPERLLYTEGSDGRVWLQPPGWSSWPLLQKRSQNED